MNVNQCPLLGVSSRQLTVNMHACAYDRSKTAVRFLKGAAMKVAIRRQLLMATRASSQQSGHMGSGQPTKT